MQRYDRRMFMMDGNKVAMGWKSTTTVEQAAAGEAKRFNSQRHQVDAAVIKQGSSWLASLVDDLKSIQ